MASLSPLDGQQPVVYLYLDRLQLWCTRLYRRRTQGLPAEVYQGHAKRGVEVGD